MMQQATSETELLSTVGEMNPLKVLQPTGKEPVVLCVVAIWTRHTLTGNLEAKGAWVHAFWEAALKTLPGIVGCRLSWNTLFFAVPDAGTVEAVQQFRNLLAAHQDACLESFCVLCEAEGDTKHKLDVLDVLGHEVSSERDFGSSR